MHKFKKISNTIHKIKNNILTYGSWIQIADPAIAKIMASTGFDWLTVDLEHGKYSRKDLPAIFDIVRSYDCLPLARISENSTTFIKEILDAGAGGIIVPMINTAKDAEKAVAAVKYPPKGIRGIGFSNASCYGNDFNSYFEAWNDSSIVIVQIEHIEAANNLNEILKVNGVDGFIVGPYDLSGSMGLIGKFDTPLFLETLNKIRKAGLDSGKTMGMHIVKPDIKETFNKVKAGYNFIAYSIDTVVLWSHFIDVLTQLGEK